MNYSPFGGLLHLHASDIAQIQRFLDPLTVSLLFELIVGHQSDGAFTYSSLAWVVVAVVTAFLLDQGGIYRSYRQKSLYVLARRVTSNWLFVLTCLLLIAFLSKTSASYSRLGIIAWGLVSWLALLVNHVGFRKLLRWQRQQGRNSRTILYWGTPQAAADFASQLQDNPWMGLRLVAWFSPVMSTPDSKPAVLPNCSGSLADMRRWLESHTVDRIVFSHVNRDGISMEQVLRMFGDTALPVSYAPHWAQEGMVFRADQIGNQPCLDVWGAEESYFNRKLKRAFDLVLTLLALLVLTPLMVIIGCAVAFSSPGPILFIQDRCGLDGRCFRIFKFRTMRVLEAGDTPGLQQATRDDPRVTAVGRWLRQWSLDELPQLFNVLMGDMSLVGPRPHALDHNEQYRKLIPGYMQRHAFKPGITGLAQVEGFRGETKNLEAMAKRVEADLRYQRDWSLRLDIKILIKTFLQLRSPNAY